MSEETKKPQERTKEKDATCTVTFKNGYGDEAIVVFKPIEHPSGTVVGVAIESLDPEKFSNLAGEVYAKFADLIKNAPQSEPLHMGPGGEA